MTTKQQQKLRGTKLLSDNITIHWKMGIKNCVLLKKNIEILPYPQLSH